MKKIKGAFTIVLLVCGVSLHTNAQGFMTDGYGKAVNVQIYTELTGSPYLTDVWHVGEVAFKNGKAYKGIPLKYNQIEDHLLFISEKGDTLEFIHPVHEFILPVTENGRDFEKNFRSGFPAIDGNTTDNFYEVLSDGKTKALKRTKKHIQSHKEYNSATVFRDIVTNVNYFMLKSDQMQPLKTDKKGVLAALSDRAADVEKYINDNKLNVKHDDDLKKVFDYYNSL